MKFNAVFLGQSILKYQVPFDIYVTINQIYESKFKELKPANQQLVGKIQNEHRYFMMVMTKLKCKHIIYYH